MAAVRAGRTQKSHPVRGHESWWRSSLLMQARRQCNDGVTEERPSGGLSGPSGVSSLSNTTWGAGRGEESVGGAITVGVPFKGLKAKHCTVCSSHTHQLVWPPGLLKFPRGRLCHLVVNAARVSEAPSYTCLGLLRHSFPPHPGSGAKLNSWLNTFTFHLPIQERQVAGWSGVMECVFTLSWANATSEKGFRERALLFGHRTHSVS